MPSANAIESGAIALPPIDMDVFHTWRQVLDGANQLQRAHHTPEELAQCVSTLLSRDRVPHKAYVGFVSGKGIQTDVRTPISAWLEFDNGTKLALKMPDGIDNMTEEGLIAHLDKHAYRVKQLPATPLTEAAFLATAGMPLSVFRQFGAVYDDATILHTAVPKTHAREFSQQLRAKRPKKV